MRSLILAVGVLLSPAAFGRYASVQTEKVPVERLVANLEKKLAAAPKDFDLLARTARVHAMAYAAKTSELEVRKSKPDELWLGHAPKNLPFQLEMGGSASVQKTAAAHLEKAVDLYRRAEKEQPEHLVTVLGLAWCLEQSGKKTEALNRYRKVIETAYKGAKSSGGSDWDLLTESISYAKPLLDPKKDGEELLRYEERLLLAQKQPRAVTPLVVDLSGRGELAAVVDRAARVDFDLDGRGKGGCAWEWIDRDAAAWLVYDRDGTGRIDSGLDLFGAVSWWLFWRDGYEALAALDDDGDGLVAGAELAGIALWRDRDGNGRSDAGEVTTLEAHGIVTLETRAAVDAASGLLAASGTRRDGSRVVTWDWLPRCRP